MATPRSAISQFASAPNVCTPRPNLLRLSHIFAYTMENVGKSSDERSFASCCVSARARSQGDHSGSIFGITEKTASQKKYSPQAHSFNYVYLRARLLFIFDTRALASVCVCVTCRLNLFISQNHKITKSQHMLHTLYTLETKSNRPHKKLVSDSY